MEKPAFRSSPGSFPITSVLPEFNKTGTSNMKTIFASLIAAWLSLGLVNQSFANAKYCDAAMPDGVQLETKNERLVSISRVPVKFNDSAGRRKARVIAQERAKGVLRRLVRAACCSGGERGSDHQEGAHTRRGGGGCSGEALSQMQCAARPYLAPGDQAFRWEVP